MLPPMCGNWSHIPTKGVTCADDPYILLGAYGCRIGRTCKRYEGWWHVQAPKGWRWIVNIGRSALLLDPAGWIRVSLDSNPLELHAFSFHTVQVEAAALEGCRFLCGTVYDAENVPLYRTYQLRSPTVALARQKSRLMHETATLMATQLPEIGNPFAYWD